MVRLKDDSSPLPQPPKRAHFPFPSCLDKSLSNVTPQMSLIMCVANFRGFCLFVFSFLKVYFLLEPSPSYIA